MNPSANRTLPARLLGLVPGLVLALSLALPGALSAADTAPAPEVVALQTALAGDDSGAKKSAIRAVASKSVGRDDQVIPLLIGAIGDRQAGEAAVGALTSRTGQTPKDGSWKNNQALTQQSWQTWFADWQKGQAIKKIEKKEIKLEQEIARPVAPPPAEKPADGERAIPPTPAEDLGRIDRVIFKAGGSLLCYIMSKRTDSDGNLVSVRVVHPDGAGEETIAATLISRIEEDISDR